MKKSTTNERGPNLRTWAIIGRGWVGWHAISADGNTRSSGGDLIDRPWPYGGTQWGYLTEARPGALVYDASEADRDAFARLIIAGPMVNPALAPGQVDRFGTSSGEPPGSLDHIGIDDYRRLLAAIPGMRLGRVHGCAHHPLRVEWEEVSTA